MHPASFRSFLNELEKIAINLDAKTLGRISAKATKRGWSGAREHQHIKRLLNWEGRHAGKQVADLGKTVATKRPAAAAPAISESRIVRKSHSSPPKKKPGAISRHKGMAAVGAGGVALGASSATIHRQRHDPQGYVHPAV